MASLSRTTTRTASFSKSRDRVSCPRYRRSRVIKIATTVTYPFSKFPIFTERNHEKNFKTFL
jgi:hypothetical protein